MADVGHQKSRHEKKTLLNFSGRKAGSGLGRGKVWGQVSMWLPKIFSSRRVQPRFQDFTAWVISHLSTKSNARGLMTGRWLPSTAGRPPPTARLSRDPPWHAARACTRARWKCTEVAHMGVRDRCGQRTRVRACSSGNLRMPGMRAGIRIARRAGTRCACTWARVCRYARTEMSAVHA